MKTIMELLRRPLVKIIGLMLVMYFGLFSNKQDPDSLGNRLSSQNIKENFSEIHEKSNFILFNIDRAKQMSGKELGTGEDPSQSFSVITAQDYASGSGDEQLKCGDLAEISYDVRVFGSNSSLEFVTKENLIIGSNSNSLLEQKIIGMKTGGVRIINIPRDFKSGNKKIAFLLKFNEAALQYTVSLLKFSAANEGAASCATNNDQPKKDAE